MSTWRYHFEKVSRALQPAHRFASLEIGCIENVDTKERFSFWSQQVIEIAVLVLS
jgi:hypothetical protein